MSLKVGQTEERYIVPIKTRHPGYRVEIPHPELVGEYVNKNFCGVSKPQTEYLKAAIAWRDQKFAALYKQEVPERFFHRKQSNSQTGVPGVQRLDKEVKKKLKDGTVKIYVVGCYCAAILTVPGDGKRKGKVWMCIVPNDITSPGVVTGML